MIQVGSKVRSYIELTKPGILRLLVLTTICTMLVAEDGIPNLWLMLWTLIGTVLICGSANAINMVWDRDIDAIMGRTAHRPIVSGRVSARGALIFAMVIGFVGVNVLTFLVNPLAALMGICGHAFYVVIYTMWLKRRTAQNIVIGGAAGAFPALIGWAAVTGEVSATAWIIFAIICLWTPPHFWALALYKDIEYGKAGIPMMPNVAGAHSTKFQMLIYMFFLLSATTLLAVVGNMGIVYFAASVILGAGFTYCCIKTAFDDSDYWAKRTFAYSILYLALLFGAMSIDAVKPLHITEQSYLLSVEEHADRLRRRQTIEELRDLHNNRTEYDKQGRALVDFNEL